MEEAQKKACMGTEQVVATEVCFIELRKLKFAAMKQFVTFKKTCLTLKIRHTTA